ncbi:MAG: 2-oxoglutarate dehydrogenase E1 component [Candidatus Sericytochromatia bacterium]|nr:2-oxoglutarate dehydrogenase E1 component [Candidatus Sericytochromatia bacterium]
MSNSNSFPDPQSLAYVEGLYADWLSDPESVAPDWRATFAAAHAEHPTRVGPAAVAGPLFGGSGVAEGTSRPGLVRLVDAYRRHGHRAVPLDPLGTPRGPVPELEPAWHGLSPEEMAGPVPDGIGLPAGLAGGQAFLDWLRRTWAGRVAVQVGHIDAVDSREWLVREVERGRLLAPLDNAGQRSVLDALTRAAVFEDFIQKKFLGAKSFSLEGSETLIPALEHLIQRAGLAGTRHLVIGMAHRGRLNVLTHIAGKPAARIFREFEDTDGDYPGHADVKYHLGWHRSWDVTGADPVEVSLCFNPSHLEFVGPVAMGRARALRDHRGTDAMAVIIHGDAAFIGEGIAQETLNLSRLPAYASGGSLHLVVNNQVGFTTSWHEARSGEYATDVARMLDAPIFHVSAEDPAAVMQVLSLAVDYRARFGGDVVVDLVGYRRRGHNEGDEPRFTQPAMYAAIDARAPLHVAQGDALVAAGVLTRAEVDGMVTAARDALEGQLALARSPEGKPGVHEAEGDWVGVVGGPEAEAPDVDTSLASTDLERLLTAWATMPEGFTPHPKVERILEQRRRMATGDEPLDWAAGEAMAFASLAVAGHPVRLTGQDCGRGTFSHRHAVLTDVRDGRRHNSLQHLADAQGPVAIHNSPLSEMGVVGFEYGYALETPRGLVAWEAQFGDFANCAQVHIDQFITSGEAKWGLLNGLVMLLPHGYEGMGPEHSSARIERFLQLSAQDNLQVAYPTTAAQLFHLLRRQVLRPWRKPLVVFTPKSLLRHRRTTGTVADFAGGTFRRVLTDDQVPVAKARRILLCTGKVAFDLMDEREAKAMHEVAIIRVEQLHPFPVQEVAALFAEASRQAEVLWVQEEPLNMGAWPWLRLAFGDALAGRSWRPVARPASASPAAGSPSQHKKEHRAILDEALAPLPVAPVR